MQQIIPSIWGYDALNLGDPWGIGSMTGQLIHDTGGDFDVADDWASIPYMPPIGGGAAPKPGLCKPGLCHEF